MKVPGIYSDINSNIYLRSWSPSKREFVIGSIPENFEVYDGDTNIKLKLVRHVVIYRIIGEIINEYITIRIDNSTHFKLFLFEENIFENMFLPCEFTRHTDRLTDIILIGDCFTHNQFKLVPNTTVYMTRFVKLLPDLKDDEILKHQIQIVDLTIDTIINPYIIELEPLEEMSNIINKAKETLENILHHHLKYYYQTKILTFINNFIEPADIGFAKCLKQKNSYKRAIQELNLYLEDLIYNLPNVFLLDLNNLINCIGKQHLPASVTNINRPPLFKFHKLSCEDINYNHIHFLNPIKANIQYDKFKSIIHKYVEYMWKVITQKDQIKLVVFDLDNTLWRGFAVDIFKNEQTHQDYTLNSKWFTRLWCYVLKSLKSRGIYISICSKNDFDFIKKHFDKTFLGEIYFKDFVCPKINYDLKSENIKNIINETNLMPENVLFVDDNPLEREEVKTRIPGIRVVGQDGLTNYHYSYLPYLLYNAPELQRSYICQGGVLAPSLDKRMPYVQHITNKTEFLDSLKLKISAFQLTLEDPNLQRVVDLTNKTNQFNTTGKKRTFSEVVNYLQNNSVLYFTLEGVVENIYTNYGIISVTYISKNCIEQFLMSCRVLGFEVEYNVIKFINERLLAKYKNVQAIFTKTRFNTPCTGLYSQLGFTEHEDIFLISNSIKNIYNIPITSNILL